MCWAFLVISTVPHPWLTVAVMQASQKLLFDWAVSAVGKITCQWSWNLTAYAALLPADKPKLFDLADASQELHLLLARGAADPFSRWG